MSDLTMNKICKKYGSVVAVKNASLTFESGKLTALLGPSGCGKTTLLRMIAGLEMPTEGDIILGGE
ncbi:ATP-binding cassette domain-containing protein, partial [Cognatishimia sp. 1_MG-2023]|uniref:ATP-binding cassette domain-containing protein n=1 Tax=Cognatishimia sp. 1_MG-2023 TaxID=3062642 RepID=UPI0026E3CA04